MSYNNYNGGGYNRYNNNNNYGGYNNNNYGGYNGNRFNNNNGNYVKKSGCTVGNAKNDPKRPYVRGWRASKREGITTYMCSPYEGKNSSTKQHKSASGRIWENWACKVQPQNGKSYFVSCLYEPATKMVIIPELSMVLNHKGGRGGYCGRNYTKK